MKYTQQKKKLKSIMVPSLMTSPVDPPSSNYPPHRDHTLMHFRGPVLFVCLLGCCSVGALCSLALSTPLCQTSAALTLTLAVYSTESAPTTPEFPFVIHAVGLRTLAVLRSLVPNICLPVPLQAQLSKCSCILFAAMCKFTCLYWEKNSVCTWIYKAELRFSISSLHFHNENAHEDQIANIVALKTSRVIVEINCFLIN